MRHYKSISYKKKNYHKTYLLQKKYSYSYPDPGLFPLFCSWIYLSGKSKACQ